MKSIVSFELITKNNGGYMIMIMSAILFMIFLEKN